MAKANATWTVHPHGAIEKLSDRLWRVEGQLPDMPLKRVMTIARGLPRASGGARRADGDLVVHNAIALGDREMAEIDAWGKVATIVVPNGYHRLDAKVFRDRYPDATIACPAGAAKKVAEVVPVTATYDALPSDPHVELVHLDGTKQREGVMIVREPGTTSLVFNDAVFNMPHGTGFTGFIFRRLTASTGGPKISRIVRWLVIADKRAFRAHLEKLADLPDLARIVVSHHETIDRDAAATLRAVAATV